MNPPFDIIVVGGGPTGLTCAIAARLRGLSVCLFEAKSGAIDKACGEGLMPKGVAILDELGVQVETSMSFCGIRYCDAKEHKRRAEGRFRAAFGKGVRRLTLHQALVARAKGLGVNFVHERADELEIGDSEVIVNGRRGRYLVAADGLHSPIRRRMNLEHPVSGRGRYGMRRHFNTAPWTDCVEVYWSPRAEAYVTPIDDETVGVAILFDKPNHFDELMADFPLLRQNLGTPKSRLLGAGPFEQRAIAPVSGRVLLVGDAAGYVDPLTGEGITLGMKSALAAVDCIASDRVCEYHTRWRKVMRPYKLMTLGLLWITRRPWLRARLIGILSLFPRVFDLSLRLLNGR